MKDFRVVQAKIILKVTSIAPIRNFLPHAVVVIGDRLNLTKEVFYNDVEAKEFVISSPSRMILRIPPSQVGKELKQIRVLTDSQISKQDAAIFLEIGRTPKTVEGIDRLVQVWTLVFLSTPGSDIFSSQSGGGARSLVGKAQGPSVAADLATAVERTRTQILQMQAANPRIPASERLLSASLSSVSFDNSNTTVSAVVEIRNALGDGALVSIR